MTEEETEAEEEAAVRLVRALALVELVCPGAWAGMTGAVAEAVELEEDDGEPRAADASTDGIGKEVSEGGGDEAFLLRLLEEPLGRIGEASGAGDNEDPEEAPARGGVKEAEGAAAGEAGAAELSSARQDARSC